MEVNLEDFKQGLPTMTSNMGSFLYEAAVYCLSQMDHQSGIVMTVEDDVNKSVVIKWNEPIDSRMSYTWGDTQEATEYGATCLAIMFTLKFSEYTTVERACKNGGFDYWVGNASSDNLIPFQRCARLEISGILNGNDSTFISRTHQKIKQTQISDFMNMPAYISIVEFGTPRANLILRKTI